MWRHWCHASHSLVSENVSILVGVEGQLKDAVHNAALDSHLGVLQLLFARVLPNGIAGHGTVQVAQEILHRCRLVIRRCAALERWRGAADTTDARRDSATGVKPKEQWRVRTVEGSGCGARETGEINTGKPTLPKWRIWLGLTRTIQAAITAPVSTFTRGSKSLKMLVNYLLLYKVCFSIV